MKLNSKKGDIASLIYVVMFIAIMGVVIFIITHLNVELFGELVDTINDSHIANDNNESVIRAEEFRTKNAGRLWDYAFLGIFFASIIAIALSVYAVRISPVFFWVYGILSLFVLRLGAILSNLWQALAADPEFATTITQFPITNTILGTYYPLVVTGVIIITMGILFGKPPSQQEGFI